MKNKKYNTYQILGVAIGGIIAGALMNITIVTPPEQVNIEKETVVFQEVPVVISFDNIREGVIEEMYLDYMDNQEVTEDWWFGYKIMTKDYEAPPLHITDVYSEDELNYLYRCVETEVFGADFESKTHVASVVFNRLEDGRYGNSLKAVITSPNQFAYHRTYISESTIEACAYAFEIGDTTQGALSFHSGKISQKFNGQSLIFTDSAGHHFYK